MDKQKAIIIGFLQAVAMTVYVFLVSALMMSLDNILPNMPAFGIASFLLLFVLSAAFMALIFAGYPVSLFFKKDTKRGLHIMGFTVLFLALFFLAFIIIQASV